MKIGERFGRLEVLSRAPEAIKAQTRWHCRCDCGNESIAYSTHLRSGQTTSCGCYAIEARLAATTTHKMTADPAYRSWIQMRNRCNNPKATSYDRYGGLGITVCARWDSFEAFYADLGPRPSMNHTLDRIDAHGNYEPGNCKWSTRSEQQNNHRDTIKIEYKGESLTRTQWAHRYGLNGRTVCMRFNNGWPFEQAVGLTPRPKKPF